jgi:glycerophosphoryl diester phosphodiesterase
MLIDQGVRDPMPVVHAPEAQDVWPHWSLVNAALVNAAHAAGKRVLAWTVNDADAARRLAALGVDGICTDDVRLLAH